MKSKWESEKENLEQFILVEKLSYEEIGRRYGCSGSNIKKVASRIGIDLPQRRKINECETFNKGTIRKTVKDEDGTIKNVTSSICTCLNCGKEFKRISGYSNKFCCTECGLEYKHKQGYQKILDGDPSIMRANYSPKAFKDDILEEQGGVCAICSMKPEWNGKPLTFILDHIDGHASNNKRDNLRCICPNCDSQLDTYKSKNKCGERSYYRYHKYDEDTKIGK